MVRPPSTIIYIYKNMGRKGLRLNGRLVSAAAGGCTKSFRGSRWRLTDRKHIEHLVRAPPIQAIYTFIRMTKLIANSNKGILRKLSSLALIIQLTDFYRLVLPPKRRWSNGRRAFFFSRTSDRVDVSLFLSRQTKKLGLSPRGCYSVDITL